MSKFLYPIYKLKTKSYIKWWLYHKKAGGSGILSEILEGFSFNLENTLNRKFKLFEIEGNSVQDGTPSPDNEVPILSAGENGSINEKIKNKNLWDIDKFKNLYGTNTYETYNNVECLKLAGATQRYNFDGEENTQYTFQFKLIGSTINSEIGAFSLVYSDGTSDYHDGILTPKTYTFTSKANKTLVRIVWNAWSSGHFIYIDKNSMQLELGSTSTPYVPHEEQDYSIPVQQPFRSIGDVRDCFVKKSDGWYERHFIARKIFDGTEDWQFYTNSVTGLLTFRILMNEIKLLNHRKILSNNFKVIDSYNPINGEMDNHFDNYYNLECVYTEMNNVTEFKNWLAQKYANGNPAYIDYKPETPLDLPCTEEQIQQLENLPSTYKDFTIIQSEDETPAHLKIQYYKEG